MKSATLSALRPGVHTTGTPRSAQAARSTLLGPPRAVATKRTVPSASSSGPSTRSSSVTSTVAPSGGGGVRGRVQDLAGDPPTAGAHGEAQRLQPGERVGGNSAVTWARSGTATTLRRGRRAAAARSATGVDGPTDRAPLPGDDRSRRGVQPGVPLAGGEHVAEGLPVPAAGDQRRGLTGERLQPGERGSVERLRATRSNTQTAPTACPSSTIGAPA